MDNKHDNDYKEVYFYDKKKEIYFYIIEVSFGNWEERKYNKGKIHVLVVLFIMERKFKKLKNLWDHIKFPPNSRRKRKELMENKNTKKESV